MLVRISVDAGDDTAHAELTSLFRWLQRESAPDTRLTLVPRQDAEAQGGVFEAINALIGDGTGLGGLALSYAVWRRARRSGSKVRFERDGLTVVVEDGSPETVRRIADALSGPSPARPAAEAADPDGAEAPDEPPSSSAGPDATS
ncbi:MAG: hypothetical protein HOW97_08770 [Catenulispora sp.]|nr:hypothetical protein [Catenulispora sp.]